MHSHVSRVSCTRTRLGYKASHHDDKYDWKFGLAGFSNAFPTVRGARPPSATDISVARQPRVPSPPRHPGASRTTWNVSCYQCAYRRDRKPCSRLQPEPDPGRYADAIRWSAAPARNQRRYDTVGTPTTRHVSVWPVVGVRPRRFLLSSIMCRGLSSAKTLHTTRQRGWRCVLLVCPPPPGPPQS